jgi:RNA polymerase sigma-70 factor (ECF subfamily)
MNESDSTRLTLLLRLRSRTDQMSWREFHDRYSELLHRYARRRGATPEDADDVVQEVETSVFKVMQGFTYDGSRGRFRAYLRSAVVHVMARRAAREARQPEPLDPNALDYMKAVNQAAEDDQWEHEWRMHRLRWALRVVSVEFESGTLDAFRLHVLLGTPVKETAEQLGINAASVYQAKSRVLKRVKEKLDALDPDDEV